MVVLSTRDKAGFIYGPHPFQEASVGSAKDKKTDFSKNKKDGSSILETIEMKQFHCDCLMITIERIKFGFYSFSWECDVNKLQVAGTRRHLVQDSITWTSKNLLVKILVI